MGEKYAKYINRPLPGDKILNLDTRPLVSAHAEELPIERSIFISKDIIPETVVYQAIHLAKGISEPPEHYQKMHHHDFVETYIFLGKEEDFSGLAAELILEDERYEINSPASVYIPVGLNHKYRMLKGSGVLVITTLKDEYSYIKK